MDSFWKVTHKKLVTILASGWRLGESDEEQGDLFYTLFLYVSFELIPYAYIQTNKI
jgi:hypothetical protein